MKFVSPSHFNDPDTAARRLVEIANACEAVQDGRIYIELINLGGEQLSWILAKVTAIPSRHCLFAIASSGWTTSGQAAMSEALALSNRAVNLDAGNAVAHSTLGIALLSFERHDEAVLHVNRGSELNPGSYYVNRRPKLPPPPLGRSIA